jgi:hypothetical protein
MSQTDLLPTLRSEKMLWLLPQVSVASVWMPMTSRSSHRHQPALGRR